MSSFRYTRLSGLTLIGLALFASLEVSAPVQARTPYDGLWSVSLKVGQGPCGEREFEVFIRNGEISHAGDRGFFTAEGRVWRARSRRGEYWSVWHVGQCRWAALRWGRQWGLAVSRVGVLRAVGGRAPQLVTRSPLARPTLQSASHKPGS
jgi:hypothetical protein